MKTIVILLIAALSFTSCQSQQSKAVKDQQDAYKVLNDLKAKNRVPTAEGSWTMTAQIDGKPWTAASMMLPAAAGRIIGYYKDGDISLPYWEQGMEVGHKQAFGENNAVDFSPVGKPDFWGGRSGEMEITKVAGGWVEGKFFFTAALRGSDRKIQVTDGFFRIQVK